MSDYEFTVVIDQDEDGRFVAICPALQGCYTEGETEEEARNLIADAINLHVLDHFELGKPFLQMRRIYARAGMGTCGDSPTRSSALRRRSMQAAAARSGTRPAGACPDATFGPNSPRSGRGEPSQALEQDPPALPNPAVSAPERVRPAYLHRQQSTELRVCLCDLCCLTQKPHTNA
jgi:predicted RNase H-like HicB family nuclease